MSAEQYIEPEKVIGYEFPPQTISYSERDVSIYALGIGAARDPMDLRELSFVYERHSASHKVLPTFGVLLGRTGGMGGMPGLKFKITSLLHGEEYLELARPLPDAATLTVSGRVKAVYDKGNAIVMVTEAQTKDEHGQVLTRHERAAFIRGLGGFGGERGPAGKENMPPERAPDKVQREAVAPHQALLYRLSGDRNPLHADPAVANAAGFPRPILHGLCTYGFASRAVLKHYCDNEPACFKSIKARFSQPFYPGETLVTEMWQISPTRIVFQCKAAERDVIVLMGGAVEVKQ